MHTPRKDVAMAMSIIKIETPSYIRNWVKQTTKIGTDDHVLIIGGAARMYLNLVIGGKFVDDSADDIDFLIISNNEEQTLNTDEDCQFSGSLERYMGSRDFTVNEVAMDGDFIYTTRKCLKDSITGIVRPCVGEVFFSEYSYEWSIDARLVFRASRFALKYSAEPKIDSLNWDGSLSYKDFNFLLQGIKALGKSKSLLDQYLEYWRFSMDEFIEMVKDSNLREKAEVLAMLS